MYFQHNGNKGSLISSMSLECGRKPRHPLGKPTQAQGKHAHSSRRNSNSNEKLYRLLSQCTNLDCFMQNFTKPAWKPNFVLDPERSKRHKSGVYILLTTVYGFSNVEKWHRCATFYSREVFTQSTLYTSNVFHNSAKPRWKCIRISWFILIALPVKVL